MRPPRPTSPIPEPVHGRIRRRPILGGLLNEYEAAALAGQQALTSLARQQFMLTQGVEVFYVPNGFKLRSESSCITAAQATCSRKVPKFTNIALERLQLNVRSQRDESSERVD